MKPKITIGVTTYNRPLLLIETIKSIINQTYHNIEIIISNDFVEKKITKNDHHEYSDKRLKIVNQPSNLGEHGNMKYLLEMANGEWFLWLADDDLLHPNYLKFSIENLESNKNQNIIGVYSNYYASENPIPRFPDKNLINKDGVIFDSLNFIKFYSKKKIRLIGNYGLMRTSLLQEIGGIKKLGNSFSPYSDNLLPIIISKFGDIMWIDLPLVFLRVHVKSISASSSDFNAYTSAEIDFIEALKSMGKEFNEPKIIMNFIKWFLENEIDVLLRNNSINKLAIFNTLIKHQFFVNIKYFSFWYKLLFLFFLLKSFFRRFISGLLTKFKLIIK